MSNDKPMEFCEGQFHPAASNSNSNPSTSHTALGSPEFDYNNGPMGGLVRQKRWNSATWFQPQNRTRSLT